MKAAPWQRSLIVLTALLGTMSDAKAEEWFVLDPLEWALVLDFDGYWRNYKDSADTQQTKFEEGVRLRQRGHSVDPRIARFFLDLHPRLAQVDFENGGDDEDFDNSFLDYNASLSLLHGTPAPFSFEARAGRSTSTIDGDLGSRTDLKTSNEAITLSARNEFFPSTLTFSQRDLDEKFRSGVSGATTDREEAVDTVTFRGHSSKMDLLLEQIEFNDRLPKDNDYDADVGRLNHALRWGKGSNLNSLLDYYKREDFLPYERFLIDESARLQHTRDLYSSYDYSYSSVKNGADTKRNYARAGLTHQLYRNLTSSFYLKGSNNDVEGGAAQRSEEEDREARLDLSYTKKIPRGGRLSAGLSVAEGTVDRDVEEDVVLQVFEEFHIVKSTYIVILNERFIDTSTIIVTDGPPPFTVVYIEGVNYTVVPAANDLTELHIITPGPINEGDTILVSYDYQPVPSVEYDTSTVEYRLGLDYGWINVFHRTYDQDQDLVSEQGESFLSDRRDATSGLRLTWNPKPATRMTVGAETRSYRYGEFDSDTDTFRLSLIHRWSARTSLTLTATRDSVDNDGRKSDTHNADLAMRWLARRGLIVEPRIGTWRREQRRVSDDRFKTVAVDLRWFVRKLVTEVSVQHNEWSGTTNNLDENRLMFTFTRRSR